MIQNLSETVRTVRSFLQGERASVAVTSALVLPVLLGMAGLVIEYGDALVTRAETQRIADLAVHAGALAYGSGDIAAMTAAVRRVGRINGVADDQISAVADGSSGAGPVVRVTLTTERPLVLARLIAARTGLDVTVRSAATLERGEPACVHALNPAGSGITMSGGTSLEAKDCAVASNAGVTASGSARIVTETLAYDSATAPSFTGGASLQAPNGGTARILREPTADPLATNAGVAATQARIAVAAALQAPAAPAVPAGTNIEFGWNQSQTKAAAVTLGCTATMSGNTWTFGCPANAVVRLGNLTVAGGINLDFGLAGTVGTTYSFSGLISNTGTNMRFGPGIYQIAGGIRTGGGTTTSFGAGSFSIGRGAAGCSGSDRYSIYNTSTMTFAGPSVFALQGGIRNVGGASLVLGSGQGNTIHLGPGSNGAAPALDGGSNTILGDTSGVGDRFRVVGHITSGGGSCLLIGAATNHDIAGHLSLAGGVTLDSGLYAIDGYLHLGASGGGSVSCGGQSVSLRALEVTLALSGKGVTGSNKNCNGQSALCVGAGYNGMLLVSPSTGPYAKLAVIGPVSAGVTAGATFTGGASGGQISGAFYFPNGPILLSGGASAGQAGGGCLQTIGATVTMTGGTTAASECIASGTGSGDSVRMLE